MKIKYKEIKLKKFEKLAIPVKRQDGKDDYFVISIDDDNVIWINNRFMGACLEPIDYKENEYGKSVSQLVIR